MNVEVQSGEHIEHYAKRLVAAVKKEKVEQVEGKFNDIPLTVTSSSTVREVVDTYWDETEKR